jgi:hypothetical protein
VPGDEAEARPLAWPALPYLEWRATRDTLHMYAQVIGKLRLAYSPFEPEWANVALYVTARGLGTPPITAGSVIFDAELDLAGHELVLRSTHGRIERRPLGGPVAEFHDDVITALARLGAEAEISELPSEVEHPIPFPEDRVHDTYEPEQAERFHRVLTLVDAVMREHRARFRGRTTLVQFFWGSFDLALTRYSGRPAQPPTGAGTIMRYSEDAEEICAGWWPGDERMPEPAFYAYAYPAPRGLEKIEVSPPGAAWSNTAGEFLLGYDAVRQSADPRRALLEFLRTTYEGCARLSGWNEGLTQVTRPPAAGHRRRSRSAVAGGAAGTPR